MAAQPLLERVARATMEGWCCLFTGMHFTLNALLRRKWSLQVLVGLPWVSTRPEPSRDDT